MKRTAFLLALALAVAAWGGRLPNAGDEEVLRFGPFLSGAFEDYSYVVRGLPFSEYHDVRSYGAGGGAWGQYDATWLGYAMRFGVTKFGGSGFTETYVEWDHDYYLYLALPNAMVRPFIEPNACIGSAGGFKGHIGINGGLRWNMRGSPFYMTLHGGVRYVWNSTYENGNWSFGKVSCYLPLTDAIALWAAAETEYGGRDYAYEGNQSNGPRWRGRLDVGPSWAF